MKGKKQKEQCEKLKNENVEDTCTCECKEGFEQNECCEDCEETNTAGSEQEQLEQLKNSLQEKSKESEENYNRFLRMQADFENYKKRIAREREEFYYSSLEGIVKEVLPVIDNLERALLAFKGDNLDNKYIDGIDMISKQLFSILEKNGLKEIEALDKEFDPNIHHAVMQVEGEEDEENKVKEVFQKGYTLGTKVVRPALVKVCAKSN
jgi:molecular chaperone GrpE